MTSKEVYDYIEQDNVKELYKKFTKAYLWLDEWSDKLIEADLLNEYELAFMLDKSTGIYAKLSPVVSALESYIERVLYNTESKYYDSCDKVKAQDTAVGKAKARAEVSQLRDYLADFKGYFIAAQQMICSAQSRLKRLVIEGGAKGVMWTGEKPVNQDEPEGWVE